MAFSLVNCPIFSRERVVSFFLFLFLLRGSSSLCRVLVQQMLQVLSVMHVFQRKIIVWSGFCSRQGIVHANGIAGTTSADQDKMLSLQLIDTDVAAPSDNGMTVYKHE